MLSALKSAYKPNKQLANKIDGNQYCTLKIRNYLQRYYSMDVSRFSSIFNIYSDRSVQ